MDKKEKKRRGGNRQSGSYIIYPNLGHVINGRANYTQGQASIKGRNHQGPSEASSSLDRSFACGRQLCGLLQNVLFSPQQLLQQQLCGLILNNSSPHSMPPCPGASS